MGCGCNKNKNVGITGPQFRQINQQDNKGFFSKKISLVQSFAMSLASRGLNNNKTNKPTKQLRVLSCFGNQSSGGQLPPCQHLKESQTPGKHFCGGCGCGDKPLTWLMAEGEEYSKLDFPKLACPLNMPGFTNYVPSKPDEANEPVSRKYFIENIEYKNVVAVPVSLPEPKPLIPKEQLPNSPNQ